jgi:16S rRNA G966 N2-methylase RsmD
MIEDLIQLCSTADSKQFIQDHRNFNVDKLFFKYSNSANKRLLIEQIALRKKLNKKLPEWTNHNGVIFSIGVSTEQASSEATAKLKSSLLNGRSLMDITGGMGVDSYYLSKGFNQVQYVEQQEVLASLTKHNLSVLGANNITTFNGDGLSLLKESDVDYVYVDPARRDPNNNKLVSFEQCEPNVIKNLDILCKDNRHCIIKASPMLDISLALKELKHAIEVWIISYRNECKELVFVLNKGTSSPFRTRCFNIHTNDVISEFSFDANNSHSVSLANQFQNYLYEPNASVMKAHAGDALAAQHGLQKLHSQTNLYTKDEISPNYPGKVFKVINVFSPYPKSLKKRKLNVISRNFPDKANRIEQRLRLKPSDKDYLIACKTSFNQFVFIEAQQLDSF